MGCKCGVTLRLRKSEAKRKGKVKDRYAELGRVRIKNCVQCFCLADSLYRTDKLIVNTKSYLLYGYPIFYLRFLSHSVMIPTRKHYTLGYSKPRILTCNVVSQNCQILVIQRQGRCRDSKAKKTPNV